MSQVPLNEGTTSLIFRVNSQGDEVLIFYFGQNATDANASKYFEDVANKVYSTNFQNHSEINKNG